MANLTTIKFKDIHCQKRFDLNLNDATMATLRTSPFSLVSSTEKAEQGTKYNIHHSDGYS